MQIWLRHAVIIPVSPEGGARKCQSKIGLKKVKGEWGDYKGYNQDCGSGYIS